MLTGTIDACIWFLMQQTSQAMLYSDTFHCLHNKLVVVNCDIGCFIDRSQLMLCRSYFIMLCFCRNT